LINDNDADAKAKKQEFAKMIAAFSWALNYQLRNKNANAVIKNLLSEKNFEQLKDKKFVPVILLKQMGAWLNERKKEGKMDSIILTAIDNQLNGMSQIIGGCERIANTPLPFAYSVLLHRTVYLYCFWLPFGLVDVVGWMMPVIVLFISYTFIALDAIIQEIQEPFGEEENDLALNGICETIQFSVFELADIPQDPLVSKQHYFID